ncbi:hypothetical protein BH09PAT2_BH09PAT2_04110 [soil metagenome]
MKKRLIGLILIIIIALGFYLFRQSQQTKKNASPQITPSTTDQTTQAYSLETVAAHSQGTDCWIAIEGKVYNVTQYIADKKHPGGDYILLGCGKDATTLFNNRPENEGPHPAEVKELLKQFYIGDLQ